MAWNQPGNSNNNPWGKKPAPGGGDFDQAFKDWQKRIESALRRWRRAFIHAVAGPHHRLASSSGCSPASTRCSRATRVWCSASANMSKRWATAGAGACRGPSKPSPRSTSRASSPSPTSRACSPRNRTWSSCRWPCSTASRAPKTICSRCANPSPRSAKSAKAPFAKWWGATTSRPSSKPAASRSPKTRASSCSARSTSTAPASKCAA